MIERTYRCNLCRDSHEQGDLIGIRWGNTGSRTTLGALIQGWAKDSPANTEHHLCESCMDSLVEIHAKRRRGEEPTSLAPSWNQLDGEIWEVWLRCKPEGAHLIAAAPDLCQALEDLMRRLDDHFGGPVRSGDWKEQEAARAALAKARGTDPTPTPPCEEREAKP